MLGGAQTQAAEHQLTKINHDAQRNLTVLDLVMSIDWDFDNPPAGRDKAFIEGIIRQLDVQPLQVLIEAVILSVSLDNSQSLGVNFSVIDNLDRLAVAAGNQNLVNLAAGFTPAVVTGIAKAVEPISTPRPGQLVSGYLGQDQGMKFGFISNNVSGFVKNLETISKVNVLASPRILVVNKQRAEIQLGQRLGYLNTFTNLTNSLQTVQFLSVGTLLTLRPFIASDGMIRMEIHPEKSSGNIDLKGVPQARTSELTTNILVPDGITVVIGGLIDSTDTGNSDGLIGLSRLPFLGPLFRQQASITQKTEFLVLLTPRIITRGSLPAPQPGIAPNGFSGVPNSGPMPGPGVGHLTRPVSLEGLPELPGEIGPGWGERLRSTPSDAPVDPNRYLGQPELTPVPPVLGGRDAARRPEVLGRSTPASNEPEVKPKATVLARDTRKPAWPVEYDDRVAKADGRAALRPGPLESSKRGYRPGDISRALVEKARGAFGKKEAEKKSEVVPASFSTPRIDTKLDGPPRLLTKVQPVLGYRHTVQYGEDFASIARAHYGSALMGPALWSANRDIAPSARGLRPGQTIVLPPADVLESLIERGLDEWSSRPGR